MWLTVSIHVHAEQIAFVFIVCYFVGDAQRDHTLAEIANILGFAILLIAYGNVKYRARTNQCFRRIRQLRQLPGRNRNRAGGLLVNFSNRAGIKGYIQHSRANFNRFHTGFLQAVDYTRIQGSV